MDMSIIIIYICAPLLVGAVGYIVKSHAEKVHEIELKLESTVTEPQVRQLIADKLDPIKEDLNEIKETIKSLYRLYANKPN